MYSCIYILVHLLFIYFVRYSRRSWHKITARVNVPLELNLQPYCYQPQEQDTVTPYSHDDYWYDLSSIIVHHGSGFSCGHYSSYCWNSEAGEASWRYRVSRTRAHKTHFQFCIVIHKTDLHLCGLNVFNDGSKHQQINIYNLYYNRLSLDIMGTGVTFHSAMIMRCIYLYKIIQVYIYIIYI